MVGGKGGVVAGLRPKSWSNHLLWKNLPFTVTHTDRDTEGHRVTITLLPEGLAPMTAIKNTNLYAPNSPNREHFQSLGDWFYNTHEGHHIMGGDLNTTLQDIEDRSKPEGGGRQDTKELNHL